MNWREDGPPPWIIGEAPEKLEGFTARAPECSARRGLAREPPAHRPRDAMACRGMLRRPFIDSRQKLKSLAGSYLSLISSCPLPTEKSISCDLEMGDARPATVAHAPPARRATTFPDPGATNRLMAALRWVGNPLEWSLADKCLLIILGIMLPANGWFVGLGYMMSSRGQQVAYVDPSVMPTALWVQLWVFCGSWVLLALAAFASRRRAPNTPLVKHAVVQLFCINVPVVGYGLGIGTSEFLGVLEISGAIVGLLMFDGRSVLWGIFTFQVMFLSLLGADLVGLIPHAPVLAAAPVSAGQLAPSWVLFSVPALVAGWSSYFLLYYIFGRWRDREAAVVRTSEQLGRAMEVISKYVARQVAERILDGSHELAAIEGRRRLTLFFSDIKDFSDAADRLEPEDLSEVLNEYLAEMVDIAEAYGGTIDKFVGDAIMIFFGAPTATDDIDHALRATRMAIAMQERMGILRERWRARGFDSPFEIRVGINTGQVSLGSFGCPGRMDYTAIGRQVNLAARLESHCEPGRILISHPTWVLIQDHIDCRSKGDILVKGIHNPVKVYEVLGEREAVATATTG
jgi:class 3 adenylate cyclase